MKTIYSIILFLLCSYSITFSQINSGNSIYSGQAEIELTILNPIYPFELKYNSGQKEQGLLGLGWSTEFEKSISAVGDGTYLLKSSCNCPDRQENYSFVAIGWDASELSAVVDKMLPLLAAEYKKEELLNDFELRYGLLESLINNNKWTIPRPEIGQVFYAFESPTMSMEILKDGYKYKEGPKTYFFDQNGTLYKIIQNKKVFLLQYNDTSQLTSIYNSEKGNLDFLYNRDGLLSKVKIGSEDYFNATYQKDKLGSIQHTEKNYTLFYHKNDLISKVFEEEIGLVIQYQYDHNQKVIFKKTNRAETKYLYKKVEGNPQNKINLEEIEYVESWDGLDSSKADYLIAYGLNSLGKKYLQSLTSEYQGIVKRNKYAEGGSCQILETEKDESTTHFIYNQRGRMIGKYNDKGAMLKMVLDPSTQKITQTYNSEDRSYWYLYDDNNNLSLAEDVDGQKIEFIYNKEGKIMTMLHYRNNSSSRKILNFEYNEEGKPTTIGLEGVGILNVSYDEYGEIRKVESPQGHKMALQITQAFQNTLALTKVEGVNTKELYGRSGDNEFNYESSLIVDGLRVVGKNASWGYQDSLGHWQIPADFEYVADFKNGWGIVRKNLKYAALKADGSYWLPLKYDFIATPHNGYIRIKKNGLWGLIDLKGQEILSPKYNYLFDMDDSGYLKAQIGTLWNRIDSSGVLFFDQNLKQFSPWNKTLWLIEDDSQYGIYNTAGKELLPVKYDRLQQPDEHGIFLLKSGNSWNIARIRGEEIILSEDLAYKYLSISKNIIKAENLADHRYYGLIDSVGKVVLAPQYEDLSRVFGDVQNGGNDALYYRIQKEGKIGFVNAHGILLVEPIYDQNENLLSNAHEDCFYYLANDSIYLTCKDSLSSYQESYGRPTFFIAQEGASYGLLQKDTLNNKTLTELLSFKYKDLIMLSAQFLLRKKKKNYELYDITNQKVLLKNIKSYVSIVTDYYEHSYLLNLKKGYQFLSKKENILSPLFKNIQSIDGSYHYIVQSKKGYGVFSLSSFKLIIPDEYNSIREEDGNIYGMKNAVEQQLELDY